MKNAMKGVDDDGNIIKYEDLPEDEQKELSEWFQVCGTFLEVSFFWKFGSFSHFRRHQKMILNSNVAGEVVKVVKRTEEVATD